MRIIKLLLFIALLQTIQANGQYIPLFQIKAPTDFIAVDNLNNIYRVHQSEITKYNAVGELQFRYSDKQLGNIGTMDVSYPLRPLLVYPDLNYLALLDNTLSNNRGTINMTLLGVDLAILAAASVQNHFWFYDAMNFRLVRTNENFNQVSSTGNLAQILGIELSPNKMVEYANRLYLNNPATGILVFDIFGTYIKTIPLKGLVDFQVFDNEVVYCRANKLIRYNTMNFTETTIELPLECTTAYLQKNRIVVLNRDGITVLAEAKD